MILPYRITLLNSIQLFELLNLCFFDVLDGLYQRKTGILEQSAMCTKEATGRRG